MSKIFVKTITKDTAPINRKSDTAATVWNETFNKELEISKEHTVLIEGTELKIISMQSSGSFLAYVCDAKPLENGHDAYVLYTDLPWFDPR